MIIRPFQNSDANQICELIKETLLHNNEKNKVYPQDAVNDFVKEQTVQKVLEKAKQVLFLVIEIDKKVIGIGGLKEDEIKSFFILPKFQMKGFGTKILQSLEDLAKQRNVGILKVASSPNARLFYESNGFKLIKVVKNNIFSVLYDDYLMEKEI